MPHSRRSEDRPQQEHGVAVTKDRYAASIDEHLRTRRGSALGLSASDWSAVEGWWERGVPLWIILSALDEVFDRPPAGPIPARTLRYCAPIIEERFRAHTRTQVPESPAPDATGRETASRMTALLSEAARAARGRGEKAAAARIEAAASDAGALATGGESAALESLDAIGRDLVRALRECLDADRLAALSQEADEALAAHAERMTVTALRTTRERFLDRRVAEIFGIPDAARL